MFHSLFSQQQLPPQFSPLREKTIQSDEDTFTVYRSETVKAHDYQRQDGVYHLICVDSSISPTVNEFDGNKFNQNITDLYHIVYLLGTNITK